MITLDVKPKRLRRDDILRELKVRIGRPPDIVRSTTARQIAEDFVECFELVDVFGSLKLAGLNASEQSNKIANLDASLSR